MNCLVKRLDCCVQGEDHSKGSECDCLSGHWIAEPFVTKLDMMMQHQEWSVIWKDWFAIFKDKDTLKARKIVWWLFLQYPLNCWAFCNHHHHHHCLMKRLDYCVQGHGCCDGTQLYWMFVSPLFCVPLILCNQTGCVDELLLITRPNASQVVVECLAFTDSSTVTCTVSLRQKMGVFCLAWW